LVIATATSQTRKSDFSCEHHMVECPELQQELFASLHAFMMGMCERHRCRLPQGWTCSAAEGVCRSRTPRSFIQINNIDAGWRTQKLLGARLDKVLSEEFCPVNRELRVDTANIMQHLVVIISAIDALSNVLLDSSYI
jgi:hypothetical protein